MDQLTNLEIADVQNRWHEAGRPGLGSLGVTPPIVAVATAQETGFLDWLTGPMDYAAKYYGILQEPPPPPKKFPSVFVEQAKPEPTDRVAVTPGTINTAYLYLPGHDPESVAAAKKLVDERKSIYDVMGWPKTLQPGTKESTDLMTAYYKALAEQQATGKATPASPAPGDMQQRQIPHDKPPGKKTGDWQQYVPWGVAGVLGLAVLIVALRR